MERIGLVLALIFVLTLMALAQSSRPSAKYGGTRGNPRLIELSNMAGDSEGCVKRGPYIGTLVQRNSTTMKLRSSGLCFESREISGRTLTLTTNRSIACTWSIAGMFHPFSLRASDLKFGLMRAELQAVFFMPTE